MLNLHVLRDQVFVDHKTFTFIQGYNFAKVRVSSLGSYEGEIECEYSYGFNNTCQNYDAEGNVQYEMTLIDEVVCFKINETDLYRSSICYDTNKTYYTRENHFPGGEKEYYQWYWNGE